MVILVSDLHLLDRIGGTTFNARAFIDRITVLVDEAKRSGVTDITLVLLGDIFEILKSEKWLEANVRPWEICNTTHVDTVDAILQGIIESNGLFFDELQNLQNKNLKVEYIPGNHDWPLNTDMGAKARVRLQAAHVLSAANGQKFPTQFADPEHRLLAMHGHEWDPANRYGDNTAAIGDAIVIELILQLPILVRQKLKLGNVSGTGILEFLDELDNIRPHTLRVIAQWVNGGLAELGSSMPSITKEVDRTFTELVERILFLERSVPFETFAVNTKRLKALSSMLTFAFRKAGFLRTARFLPSGEESVGTFRDRARREFQRLGREYQFIVCGHTHAPLIVPIDTNDGEPARLYINTGTWRRVRPVARSGRRRGKTLAFSCWDEECLVSIFSGSEQERFSLPAFKFHRLTRGQ